MTDQETIQYLEAELRVCRFLHYQKNQVYDEWERALRRYANGETGTDIADEALGTGRFWNKGFRCKAVKLNERCLKSENHDGDHEWGKP